RDTSLRDQTIEHSRLVERYEPGDGVAVVGHRDLGAVPDLREVPTEVVTQLPHSGFHGPTMAPSEREIQPHVADVPSAGFEPAHTAPEADALTSYLSS